MVDEDLNESALFNETVSDEPVADTPVVEEAAPQAEVTNTPARDDAGRFASKEATTEAPAAQVDDTAAHVPSWRVREINEEKRALAEEVATLKAEKSQWQQPQQRAAEPTAQPVKQVEEPDPLLDPKGYREFIRNETRQEILNERREESLQRAHSTYKKDFEEAYTAAQQKVDPALKVRMQNSRDPGETLMQWHREQKTNQEVGGDLAAYKQRLREEALADPEFQKQAMEVWKNPPPAQQSQPNGRPAVSLPPSLNGASRSNAALKSANDDLSDAQLFQELTG